jgi:uncharacterized protein (TIGR00159 family)
MLPTQFLHWQNIVDFTVLVTVVYWFLNWARQTRVLRLLMGIGAMVLMGSLAGHLELVITAWILHLAAIASVLLLVVVYHTEIRHALSRLDPLNRLVRALPLESTSDATAIAEAAFLLAANHRWALIVLTAWDQLENLLTGGVALGGAISRQILEAIFRKMSRVHDGAVIVEDGRIARVGVFLPLTRREDLALHFGTRHRAALGLTEQSDARVIVVSEERGEVSVAEGPTIRRVESAADLAVQIQRTTRRRCQAADAETAPFPHPEFYPYEFDLPKIAEVWRHGSVIGSWLLDLTAAALLEHPDLSGFVGQVSDSGEGRWTVMAAIEESVPAPVLSAALYERFSSRGEADFADRLLSAMRYQFGGHLEKVPAI